MMDNARSVGEPTPWEQKILGELLKETVSERRAARRWGIFFKCCFFLMILFCYLWSSDRLPGSDHSKDPEHTALLRIEGAIGPHETANAESFIRGLQAAFEAKEAKGIVISINSPGGFPVQADYMYQEIKRLKALHKDKAVVAVIQDLGASAAYLVASAADFIYANEASLVGSIGVLMPNYGLVNIMQKIGVDNRTFKGGRHKDMFDSTAPLAPFDQEYGQALVDDAHARFIALVKEGRGERLKDQPDPSALNHALSSSSVLAAASTTEGGSPTPLPAPEQEGYKGLIFSGLIWTGQQALPLGVIDGFGSVQSVARDLIKQPELRDYTQEEDLFERVGRRFSSESQRALQTMLRFFFQSTLSGQSDTDMRWSKDVDLVLQ